MDDINDYVGRDGLVKLISKIKKGDADNATAVAAESTRAKSAEEANAQAIVAVKNYVDSVVAEPGTASPLMDGAASVGASRKYAREDHVHPSDTSREAVSNKTTVVLGMSDSKYPTDKAVADFVNSSVATNTAHYISNNGQPFTSVAQLEAYSGTVTNNDYAFVTGTDSEGNTYYDRYKATVSGSTVTWSLEYRLNNSSFTAAQWAAINSGITTALTSAIEAHINDSSIHLPSVLPIARGGTGADDRLEAEYNLLGSIADSGVTDGTALDNRKVPLVNIDVTATNGVFRFLGFSVIWDWIKYKLGISATGSSAKFLNEQGEWTTVTSPDVSGKADKVSGATAGDVATLDANGNLVDSGKTLGTSVPADAAFTDDKVAQMMADSSDTAYPLLMAGTTDPRGRATVARYDSGVTLNPSTNTIVANISGNAATADSATAASTLSASAITSGDLDNYTSGGKRYFCNAGNSGNVSNKPSGVTGAFALDIIAHSGGITQLLYNRDSNYSYIRCCNTGVTPNTWTAWDRFSLASDVNGAYFATYGSTSHADVLAAIQAGKAVFCKSGTGTEDYAPLASISTGGVITFAKPTVAGLTAYYQLSSSGTWTFGTSADCRVAFSSVGKSENTTVGCTLTFTALDGTEKTVTVRNVVNAGNADTVDGYHIVVGSTGTNSNTIYFT